MLLSPLCKWFTILVQTVSSSDLEHRAGQLDGALGTRSKWKVIRCRWSLINPISNLMSLLRSLNKFLIRVTNISEDSTAAPEISDFFAYWNFIIYNDADQGYAECGWIWTERCSSSAFKWFWTCRILLSTWMQEPQPLAGITMAGTGRCLQTYNYSNCKESVGLCFRLQVTKYSSGGSGHYTPQSTEGKDNPTDKRP